MGSLTILVFLVSLWYDFLQTRSEEITVFLDDLGRLHFNGEVFEEKKSLNNSTHFAADNGTEEETSDCKVGSALSEVLEYGSMRSKAVLLSKDLESGSQIALPCSDVFPDGDFSGFVLLSCESKTLHAQVHCGCSVQPVVRPMIMSTAKCLFCEEHAVSDAWPIWPHRPISEGAEERRPCTELGPQGYLAGQWRLSCHSGKLHADTSGCDPSLRNNDSVPSGESRALAVTGPCVTPPNDYWWPSICASALVMTYATVAGGYGAGIGDTQLHYPYGVSVLPNGAICAADRMNHRVQKWRADAWALGSTGELSAGISGTYGNAADVSKLQFPREVYIAGRCNDLFIADESNHRIIMWADGDPEGVMVAGGNGAGPSSSQLDHPTGVYVTDADLSVYIADSHNHRIVLWIKIVGQLAWMYSKIVAGEDTVAGSALNQLNLPADVFLDSVGNLIITDKGNNRIVKWGVDATSGILIGTCLSPYGLHIDVDDNIFVACQEEHCVRRWDKGLNGTEVIYTEVETAAGTCDENATAPVASDPNYGATMNRLDTPSGVFVDSSGNLFVSDTNNHRVMKRGRGALTQWIISNAQETDFTFQISELEFFGDVSCSITFSVRSFISSDGGTKEPWTPSCAVGGKCQKDEAWIGRQFYDPSTVRCVRVIVNHGRLDNFALSIRFWTGSIFQSVYSFGGIIAYRPMLMLPPRFDPYQAVCVKGQSECTADHVVADWRDNGDRIMIKSYNCDTGSGVPGFPNNGRSADALENGTSFLLGQASQGTTLSADASVGLEYVICWCDSRRPGSNCQLSTDFYLKIGDVKLQGPFDAQTKYCWRGQRLLVENVTGVDLMGGDRVTVVSGQCGPSASTVLGIPIPDGYSESMSLPSVDGFNYNWGANDVIAPPGAYRLCFCRVGGGVDCAGKATFKANSGNLWVNGPTPGQNFICIKGDGCSIDVTGVNLVVGDTIMALVSCGQGDPVGGFPESTAGGVSAGSISTYSWGSVSVQPLVGLYYLCWCAQRYTCQVSKDYRAEVGVVTIYGPEQRATQCVLGTVCIVSGITGVGLANGDRLIVVNITGSDGFEADRPYVGSVGGPGTHCGSSSAIPQDGFPGQTEAISNGATNGGNTFEWGLIQQGKIVPAQYLVCWCHNQNGCESPASFRAELGVMTVKGPYEWKLKICGGGQTCQIEIDGVALSAADHMLMIEDECGGSGTMSKKGSSVVQARSLTSTGNLHVWQVSQLPFGGNYIACWCAVGCDTLAGYTVNMGKLSIAAPSAGLSSTCLSGTVCTVKLEGYGLQQSNNLTVITGKCVTGAVTDGVPNAGISISTSGVGPEPWQTAIFIFGTTEEPVRTVGGSYLACWCTEGCNSKQDFNTEAGILNIIAPFGGHIFTCWQGQQCNINGVAGNGLKNGDKLRISTICGSTGSVQGTPNLGISQAATAVGTSYTWGVETISSTPQSYALCWCASTRSCTSGSFFPTQIGQLSVGGPSTGQTVNCHVGQPCLIAGVKGVALRMGDRLMVLLSCGTGTPVDGSPPDGWVAAPRCKGVVPEGALQSDALSDTNDTNVTSDAGSSLAELDLDCADFGVTDTTYTMSTAAGMYRMCWCSATAVQCDSSADYGIDLGLITAVGPEAGQEFSCVPGFTCDIVKIRGVSLKNGDRWMVQDSPSCGNNDAAAVGFPNNAISQSATMFGESVGWGTVLDRTTRPAFYSICWCPYQIQSLDGSAFNAKAGRLLVAGPFPGHAKTCAVGSACAIENIEGVGLQNGDRLLVVVGDCGTGTAVPNFPNAGMSAGAQETGSLYLYPTLRNILGNTYRMCWCGASRAEVQPYTCLRSLQDGSTTPIENEYVVDVGTLLIPGTPVSTLQKICVSGMHCSVDGVSGEGGTPLVDGAQIVVRQGLGNNTNVQAGSECAQGGNPVVGFPNDAISQGATRAGARYQWGEGTDIIMAQGGNYLMCWKAPISLEFDFKVGTLSVSGPLGAQSYVCTKSSDCSLAGIQGVNLAAGDKVMILGKDQCGSAQVITGTKVAVMSTSSQIFWPTEDFQGTPNLYSLCWCFGGRGCQTSLDFVTPLGQLTIRGPLPGQNQYCDRGNDCSIVAISGYKLMEGDKSQVLVECGTGPRIDGFAVPTAPALSGDKGSFDYTWKYVTAAPGIYRICWCEVAECDGSYLLDFPMASFDVEIGIITIQGPDDRIGVEMPLQGRLYHVKLKGVQLQSSPLARLRILKKCSTNETVAVTIEGFEGIGLPVKGSGGTEFEFSEEDMATIMPAKKVFNEELQIDEWQTHEYALCWCLGVPMGKTSLPDGVSPDDVNCNGEDVSLFKQHLGAVNVLCPKGYSPTSEKEGCLPCPKGWFKESNANVECKQCPPLHTTPDIGTTSESQCFCQPGFFKFGTDCKQCMEDYYCTGGFDEDGFDAKPAKCPEGSGAFEDCPECGPGHIFPAVNISSCMCVEGYAPGEGNLTHSSSCEPCEISYFKIGRGNQSCELCSDVIERGTTQAKGSVGCVCGVGLYMVFDADGNPSLCASCPIGFYCPGFVDREECPPGTTTRNLESGNASSCECGPGYFLSGSACASCEPGGIYYKELIGNQPCSDECPTNSKIPPEQTGAKGPENCLCDEGFETNLNETSGKFTCEVAPPGSGKKIKTSARVPAVTGTMSIQILSPKTVHENKGAITTIVAAQLGLADDKNLDIKVLSFDPIRRLYEINQRRLKEKRLAKINTFASNVNGKNLFGHTRRLQDNVTLSDATNGTSSSPVAPSEGTATNVTAPAEEKKEEVVEEEEEEDTEETVAQIEEEGRVTFMIQLWQSTHKETLDMIDVMLQMEMSSIEQGLRRTPGFEGVTAVEWQSKVKLQYVDIPCPENTALVDGATFEGVDVSCLCAPGFEPLELVNEEDRIGYNDTGKCSVCRTYGPVGMYKESVSDRRCTPCPSQFTKTEPAEQASSYAECICTAGEYRLGEECIPCPQGYWCTGNYEQIKCPEHTSTPDVGGNRLDSCECDRGWFFGLSEQECIMCDEGYFKAEIANGNGRCKDRCSVWYGFRSSSEKAATSRDMCFCKPDSFMAASAASASGRTCKECPTQGVKCTGGFVNVTSRDDGADDDENANVTYTQVHARPEATKGFYMIEPTRALVAECRTSTELAGSVCMGSEPRDDVMSKDPQCYAGHEGLICGNCAKDYSRDQFPGECTDCTEMPDTISLFMIIASELTLGALWNQVLTISALVKTETQKNILTVLLRMYTHWASQVGVLGNFNLSKMKAVDMGKKGGAPMPPAEGGDSGNATNGTSAAPVEPVEEEKEEEKGLGFPPEFQELQSSMMLFKEAVPRVGSVQEILECVVDRQYPEDDPSLDKNRIYYKLVGPNLYWFFYPMLMVSWVIMVAFIEIKLIYPVIKVGINAATSGGKKKKKKSKGKAKAKILSGKVADLQESSSESSSSAEEENEDVQRQLELAAWRSGLTDEVKSQKKLDWNVLGKSMTHLVVIPHRFSFQYKVKGAAEGAAPSANTAKVEYAVLMLFRENPTIQEMIQDILPWLVITMNNVWFPVTQRLLQLIYCEPFPDEEEIPIPRLMLHTDTVCYDFGGDHLTLVIIALLGFLVWSVGIVTMIYLAISKHDLQTSFVQRNFGYLLEGYEPKCWWWEVVIKKADLATTAMITYTNLASDVRAKLLLYAAQSSIATSVQLSFCPYDDRQIGLLDRVENLGLFVRNMLFSGISFCLLFQMSSMITMFIAASLLMGNVAFLLKLVMHAADDWVATQWAMLTEARAKVRQDQERAKVKATSLKAKEAMQRKKQQKLQGNAVVPKKGLFGGKKKPKKEKEEKPEKDESAGAGFVIEQKSKLIGKLRQFFYADYRTTQLLRFNWRGPQSDTLLYAPRLTEGLAQSQLPADDDGGMLFEWGLNMRKWIFNLEIDDQLEFLVDNVGNFIYMVLVMAQFDQLPARLTDMIMLLASATKRLKDEMLHDPPQKKKPKKNKDKDKAKKEEDKLPGDESSEDEEEATNLGMLKKSMAEAIFTKLRQEVLDKRDILEQLKPLLVVELEERGIPLELAWDILDQLTNNQLRAALPNPNQLILRIRIYIVLSQCTEDAEPTLRRLLQEREAEINERWELMKFLQYDLRQVLDNDPTVDWETVRELLDRLPIEDIRQFVKDSDQAVDIIKAERQFESQLKEEGTSDDAVNVEDLNSMVMFVQKLPFDELRELLEHTQMLLDFLQLPNSEVWQGRKAREAFQVKQATKTYRDKVDKLYKDITEMDEDGILKEQESPEKEDGEADNKVEQPGSDIMDGKPQSSTNTTGTGVPQSYQSASEHSGSSTASFARMQGIPETTDLASEDLPSLDLGSQDGSSAGPSMQGEHDSKVAGMLGPEWDLQNVEDGASTRSGNGRSSERSAPQGSASSSKGSSQLSEGAATRRNEIEQLKRQLLIESGQVPL